MSQTAQQEAETDLPTPKPGGPRVLPALKGPAEGTPPVSGALMSYQANKQKVQGDGQGALGPFPQMQKAQKQRSRAGRDFLVNC